FTGTLRTRSCQSQGLHRQRRSSLYGVLSRNRVSEGRHKVQLATDTGTGVDGQIAAEHSCCYRIVAMGSADSTQRAESVGRPAPVGAKINQYDVHNPPTNKAQAW